MSDLRLASTGGPANLPFPGRARVVARSFEGDADGMQEHLRALAPDLIVQPAHKARTMKVASRFLVMEGVRLWHNAYGPAAHLMRSGDALDDLLLFQPLRGGFQSVTQSEQQARPGEMLCIYPARPGRWIIPENTEIEGLALPRRLLRERLRVLLGQGLKQDLEFTPVVETQTSAARAVRAAAQALLVASEQEGLNLEGGAIRGLSSALIDLVLEMLPNSYTDRLRKPAPQAAPRQVRRAIDFIRGHPRPVLPIDELAEICGVSPRSLQSTFLSFVGMTPYEYWRRVRVECALDELRRTPHASVSGVAAAWGFTNVTRFRKLCASSGSKSMSGR